MTTYALIVDASGNGTGSHAYATAPVALPTNEIACTAAQAANPTAWSVTNGSLVVSLPAAKGAQIGALTESYAVTISQPVSFTTHGGVAQTFQADQSSVANLAYMLNGFSGAQAVPTGFYWVALDNTQVPFVYADLQGLAAAFAAQGNTAFQKLQTLKAQVRAATTVAAVQAVVWS